MLQKIAKVNTINSGFRTSLGNDCRSGLIQNSPRKTGRLSKINVKLYSRSWWQW